MPKLCPNWQAASYGTKPKLRSVFAIWGRLAYLSLSGTPTSPLKRGKKMRKESQFNKDIKKVIKKEMLKRGQEESAIDFIVNSYDFDSYLLEGSLSHLEDQIRLASASLEA
jgi:hypothetical protein